MMDFIEDLNLDMLTDDMPFSNVYEKTITLGEEQEEALNKIKEFLKSASSCFALYGSAGSGKSYTLKAIIDYLNSKYIPYCLCAPTHKAALVIEKFTNRKAFTLHSLLAMSPKLDILKLNFKQLEFNSGESKEIPENGVVICDEASMINDDLFDFLVKRCESFNSKVILVGDSKQIQPVKQKNKSKVFAVKNKFELTKIYRQENDSGLVDLLITLREKPVSQFHTIKNDNGSLYCINDLKTFLKQLIAFYKESISSKDILQTKLLAYTNKRVDIYNNFLHNHIFNSGNQYNKYEFLTCFCNMQRGLIEFWNSMDYIIVEEPEKIDFNIPEVGIVPGYKLTLYDSLSHEKATINIIDKDYPNYTQLAAVVESLRLDAVYEENSFKKRLAWKKYFKTMDAFTTPVDLIFDNRVICKKSFDYGYAITTHRSQGSTINNVFIDMEDIFKQKNTEELRQLQYVALSRTAKDCYLYL